MRFLVGLILFVMVGCITHPPAPDGTMYQQMNGLTLLTYEDKEYLSTNPHHPGSWRNTDYELVMPGFGDLLTAMFEDVEENGTLMEVEPEKTETY